MDEPDFRKTYSTMSDDQLLHLSLETGSMLSEAKEQFEAECRLRRIDSTDFKEYASDIRLKRSAWDEQKSLEPVAQTFNGFGTTLYGKYYIDGDLFITTKWAVFFWIPLLPIRSLLVKKAGFRAGSNSFLPGWTRSYFVYGEAKPNIRQVLYVCFYLASLASILWISDTFRVGPVVACALLAWLCTPFLLRKIRKRKLAKHISPSLGG